MRLPTSDEDKRAVELDQFPSAVIESIQVSKTFTPDQQGDASGGAVDVRLKGIPDEPWFFQVSSQTSFNSQVAGKRLPLLQGRRRRLLGKRRRRPRPAARQPRDELDGRRRRVAHATRPTDYKWSIVGGRQARVRQRRHDRRRGQLLLRARQLVLRQRQQRLVLGHEPRRADDAAVHRRGRPQQGEFKTSLFDVTQAAQSVQWGGARDVRRLDRVPLDRHDLPLHAHDRGHGDARRGHARQAVLLPGLRPERSRRRPGHDNPLAAPWVRFETLDYTERKTESLQFRGHHKLLHRRGSRSAACFETEPPELDWTAAFSSAASNQPDKRQFGSIWVPADRLAAARSSRRSTSAYGPAQNINLGNFQRIWEDIDEESEQYAASLKLPFKQWSDDRGLPEARRLRRPRRPRVQPGHVQQLRRPQRRRSPGEWEDPWSTHFPDENHPITAATTDVDYTGEQKISAFYTMLDLPLTTALQARSAACASSRPSIGIINHAEADAVWFPPDDRLDHAAQPGRRGRRLRAGRRAAVARCSSTSRSITSSCAPPTTRPSRARPSRSSRRSSSRTTSAARSSSATPSLGMSALKNYDLRADWTPYEGGLVSASWFNKDIKDPIEYVQKLASGFDYTTAGQLSRGQAHGLRVRGPPGPRPVLEAARGALGRRERDVHRLGGDAARRTRSTRSTCRTSSRR